MPISTATKTCDLKPECYVHDALHTFLVKTQLSPNEPVPAGIQSSPTVVVCPLDLDSSASPWPVAATPQGLTLPRVYDVL